MTHTLLILWHMEGEMSACDPCRILTRLAVIWGIIGLSGICSWADNEVQRRSLRALQGVGVYIEKVDPVIEQAGLTRQQLHTDVELRLRKANIPIVPKEHERIPGNPYLAVTLGTRLSPPSRILYSVEVELYQMVSLETDGFKIRVPTWYERISGIVGHDYPPISTIRDVIGNFVDKFVNAYLSVHPSINPPAHCQRGVKMIILSAPFTTLVKRTFHTAQVTMNHLLTTAVLLACSLALISAADAITHERGSGALNCKAILQAEGGAIKVVGSLPFMWALGYLTAQSETETGPDDFSSRFATTPNEDIARALTVYCKTNPLSSFTRAVWNIYKQLGGKGREIWERR
jgi:hypothetical protein